MAFDFAKPAHGGVARAPIVVLYGQSGIGKTTIGAMFPNPVFADIERGIPDDLRVPRHVMESTADIHALIDALLTQEHPYNTLVIDSATAIIDKIWQPEICKQQRWFNGDGSMNMGPKGYNNYGAGDKIAGQNTTILMSKIHQLRETRNMAVVILGHVKIAKINPPDGEAYNRYDVNLPPNAVETMTQRADLVAFLSYPILVMKDENQASGKGRFTGDPRLHFRPQAAYHAKNRYNMPEHVTIPQGNPLAGYADMARHVPFLAHYLQQSAQQPAAVMTK